MKLTYDNCDQLKLVNGRLVHRKTGKTWVLGDKLCPYCGDAFLRRSDNPHNISCEKKCHHFGKGNSLTKRYKEVVRQAELNPPMPVSIPTPQQAAPVVALLPTVATIVSAAKKNGNKNVERQVEQGMQTVWDNKCVQAQTLLATEAVNELESLKRVERTQDPTDDLAPFLGNKRTRRPMSEETKEKIRIANKGKTRSMETRMKMSQARLGKKYAILPSDARLPIQISELKQGGQDVGVIAAVAIKKEHGRLVTFGQKIANRYRSILNYISSKR